jgi:plastocyanin
MIHSIRRIRTVVKNDTLAVLTILCVTLAVGSLLFFTHRTVVVHRTERGFEPKSISIHKGDTVVFVADTGKEFWPASDNHPSHTLYPEFDPRRALSPKERWSFTFDRAGVWAFHDHLAPEIRGAVLVVGAPGESAKNCLKNSPSTSKAYCYAADITSVIEEKGPDAAFVAFAHYYADDPTFRNNCHDVMHVFGRAAYDEFAKNNATVVRQETSYCGYGFYHGFIEEMFSQKGPDQFADGKRYCDSLADNPAFPSKNAAHAAMAACYHGMGHAVFDSLDSDVWGKSDRMVSRALLACRRIASTDEQYVRCGSGVFNSLAIAYGAKNYGLAFDKNDPTAVCRTQEVVQQSACYAEIVSGYFHYKKFNRAESVAFIEGLGSRTAVTSGITAFFDDDIRYDREGLSLEQMPTVCTALAESDEVHACIDGITLGLLNGGSPGKEYERSLQFCDFFPATDPLRAYCFKGVMPKLNLFYLPDVVQNICSTLNPVDRRACKPAQSKNL